jgi:hypothetical protein
MLFFCHLLYTHLNNDHLNNYDYKTIKLEENSRKNILEKLVELRLGMKMVGFISFY